MEDNVNHPKHYQPRFKPRAIECIEFSRLMPFSLGNAFKYIWRWKHKNGSEDLDKAKWYLTRAKTEGFSVDNGIISRMQEYIRDIESKNP